MTPCTYPVTPQNPLIDWYCYGNGESGDKYGMTVVETVAVGIVVEDSVMGMITVMTSVAVEVSMVNPPLMFLVSYRQMVCSNCCYR